MKTLKLIALAGMLAGLCIRLSSAAEFALDPESHVTLHGDSTLHPFSAKTETLTVTSDVKPASQDVIDDALRKGALKQFALSLPVASLKSKEKKLDTNMYKALKADKCPTIDFQMTGYEVQGSTVRAQGVLRIACTEQPVTLQGVFDARDSALLVKGNYPLKMTDYGIAPPKMMMGAIKVKDDVLVSYNLKLTAKGAK